MLKTEDVDPIPKQVLKNVEVIIGLDTQDKQRVPTHQRTLEKIAEAFGQPWFLYAELIFFAAWGTCSYLANIGLLASEFPKFDLHDQGIDVASLLISTGVLIHQTRQEQLSDQRSHLMLQLNLLTEQKIAKMIALLEELRADLPNVQDRQDLEAEMMQQAADPQVVLGVLQETLKQAVVKEDQQQQSAQKEQTLAEPDT
jgi:uncharacterized membrane protein